MRTLPETEKILPASHPALASVGRKLKKRNRPAPGASTRFKSFSLCRIFNSGDVRIILQKCSGFAKDSHSDFKIISRPPPLVWRPLKLSIRIKSDLNLEHLGLISKLRLYSRCVTHHCVSHSQFASSILGHLCFDLLRTYFVIGTRRDSSGDRARLCPRSPRFS